MIRASIYLQTSENGGFRYLSQVSSNDARDLFGILGPNGDVFVFEPEAVGAEGEENPPRAKPQFFVVVGCKPEGETLYRVNVKAVSEPVSVSTFSAFFQVLEGDDEFGSGAWYFAPALSRDAIEIAQRVEIHSRTQARFGYQRRQIDERAERARKSQNAEATANGQAILKPGDPGYAKASRTAKKRFDAERVKK